MSGPPASAALNGRNVSRFLGPVLPEGLPR